MRAMIDNDHEHLDQRESLLGKSPDRLLPAPALTNVLTMVDDLPRIIRPIG